MTTSTPRSRLAFERPYLTFGLAVICVVRGTTLGSGGLGAASAAGWAEVSAWTLAILGIWMVEDLDHRFDLLLQRLCGRGALSATEEDLVAFTSSMRGRLRVAGIIGAVVLPLLLLVGYLFAKRPDQVTLGVVGIAVLEMGAALIVGRNAGRTVLYGFLGHLLRKQGLALRLSPGHPDGAAGLRPVGELYFFIAGVAMLPAVFFAFWWLVMAGWSTVSASVGSFAAEWMGPYLGYLFIALAVQCCAFVLPMCSFHDQMKAEKDVHLRDADALGRAITEITAQLAQEPDTGRGDQLRAEIVRLGDRLLLLEDLPVWPVDTTIRRRFAIKNLIVFVPGLVGTVGRIFPDLDRYLESLRSLGDAAGG